MTHSVEAEGGCVCGAVRYRLLNSPMIVHCCHCTWCQRETGAAFAINALIEASQVFLLQGGVGRTEIPSASGQGQIMSRCAACGTTLWSNYSAAGEKVHFIRTGTLDAPDQFPPDIHIFTSSKQPWVTLPADIPAAEEYYRRSSVWKEEDVARYKTALSS